MSRGERSRMRQHGIIMRDNGESLVLLIPPTDGSPTTDTAFSITDEQTVTSYDSDTRVPVYGKVSYHKTADVSHDEAGKIISRKATIEIAATRGQEAIQARAVQLKDGAIMGIDSGDFSDGRASFVLETTMIVGPDEAYAGIP